MPRKKPCSPEMMASFCGLQTPTMAERARTEAILLAERAKKEAALFEVNSRVVQKWMTQRLVVSSGSNKLRYENLVR
jgi:hypothetical protein